MKKLALLLVVLSFGFAQAESAATSAPAGDGGKISKEQRKANHAAMQAERDKVKSACSEESKAASCGDKEVGKGLLKCIHEYKKATKEFKVSEGCKSAMMSLKEERQKIKGK